MEYQGEAHPHILTPITPHRTTPMSCHQSLTSSIRTPCSILVPVLLLKEVSSLPSPPLPRPIMSLSLSPLPLSLSSSQPLPPPSPFTSPPSPSHPVCSGFGHNLHFRWDQMSEREIRSRQRMIDPIRYVYDD